MISSWTLYSFRSAIEKENNTGKSRKDNNWYGQIKKLMGFYLFTKINCCKTQENRVSRKENPMRQWFVLLAYCNHSAYLLHERTLIKRIQNKKKKSVVKVNLLLNFSIFSIILKRFMMNSKVLLLIFSYQLWWETFPMFTISRISSTDKYAVNSIKPHGIDDSTNLSQNDCVIFHMSEWFWKTIHGNVRHIVINILATHFVQNQ